MPEQTTTILDATGLKARFKARCAATSNGHQNWQIRVHRGLAWLQRSTAFDEDHVEARFLYLWIAFNSLYSWWDPQRNAPDADGHARRQFVQRLLEMDSPGAVGTVNSCGCSSVDGFPNFSES